MNNDDFLKIPETLTIISYNKYGEKANGNDFIAAKIIKGSKDKFKIAMINGSVYNPIGINSNRESIVIPNASYREVSEKVFDSYIMALNKRRYDGLHIINREILNG